MSTSTASSRKAISAPLLIAVLSGLAVLATLLWLWFWKKPLGVSGEWAIKPHTAAWPIGAWGLPVVALFIFGGFAAISAYDRFKRAKNRREQIASTRLSLLGITLLAVVFPWASLGPLGTSNLINSQWSDISNEYFGTAYEIDDAREFTSSYAATRQTPDSPLQAHVATHPPGAVLSYYLARRIYESSPFLQAACSSIAASLTQETVAELAVRSNELRRTAARSAGVPSTPRDLPPDAVGGAVWCAFLISLLLALATPAVYLIGTSTPAGEREANESSLQSTSFDTAESRGLIAAALWALAPALNLFAFTLDAIIAFGAAWTLALLTIGFRSGKRFWFFAAGSMLALTSYVSFGALAIGAIAIIALLLVRRTPFASLIKDVFALGAGFVFIWLLIMLVLPGLPLVIFSQAMEAHRMATVNSRSRIAWTALNLLSFAMFCGWPLVLLVLYSARDQWRRKIFIAQDDAKLNEARFAAAIGLAGFAVVLLLNFSGQALGEVERLWLFLIPSLCVLASLVAVRWNAKTIALLLVLQAAQTLIMAGWLSPLVLPL
jgi:hypothetical protein